MGKRHRKQSGFTLLEAIVTLVIAALIVTVLMQALQQSLGLRTRLLRHEQATRMAGLQEQWFRDTLGGALADLPDGLGALRGDGARIDFVSAAPLGRAHAVAAVRWSLVPAADGVALVYDDPWWSQLQVVAGPLRDATFEYLDAAGHWQPAWAPTEEAAEEDAAPPGPLRTPPLPGMVRLRASTSTGDLVWLVPLTAEPIPVPSLRPDEVANAF